MPGRFQNFHEFYPYYLDQHSNATCRRLHYVGSLSVPVVLVYALATQQWLWLAALPLIGYGCAWVGHVVFERNTPATFGAPVYSLLADYVMLKDMLIGRIPF